MYRMRSKTDVIIWVLSLAIIAILIVLSFPVKEPTAAVEPPATSLARINAVIPPASTTTSSTTTTVAPTTTTTLLLPTRPSLCPQHYAAALAAGWTDKEWPMLDRIMHHESRCVPTAHNDNHLRGGRDNSYGLTQINLIYHDYWVLPQVNGDATGLFDPHTNLSIAHQMYVWLEERGSCGWSPWRRSCD